MTPKRKVLTLDAIGGNGIQLLLDGERCALEAFDAAVCPRPYLLGPHGGPASSITVEDLEWLQRLTRISDARVRAFDEALRTGSKEAEQLLLDLYAYAYEPTRCMQFIQSGRFVAAGFSPVTYDNTAAGSRTVPSGCATYYAWCQAGGGGAGINPIADGGGGGGGGGCSYRTGAVSGSEYGNTLTVTPGSAGTNDTGANNSVAGGNGSITGTVGGGAISMAANGGGSTNGNISGSGGSSSGGTENTTGDSGGLGSSGVFGTGGAPGSTMLGTDDAGNRPHFTYGQGGTWDISQPTVGITRLRFT